MLQVPRLNLSWPLSKKKLVAVATSPSSSWDHRKIDLKFKKS